MSRLALLLFFAALSSCTAVHYLKRNDCWVRQSVPWHGVVSEELGPCTRPAPKWSDDRFTRALQECVAQSDYRWQHRALEAWRRNQALPEREIEAEHEECALRASTEVLARNEALKQRLDDLSSDRQRLDAQNELLALELGKAANKPAGSAVAHATARGEGSGTGDGSSRNQNDSSSQNSTASSSQSQPPPAGSSPRSTPPPSKPVPGPSPSTHQVAKKPAADPRPASSNSKQQVTKEASTERVDPKPAAPKPATSESAAPKASSTQLASDPGGLSRESLATEKEGKSACECEPLGREAR